MKTFRAKLLLGAALLSAGILLARANLSDFTEIFSIPIIVAGSMLLLSTFVPRRLLLGAALVLASIILIVDGGYHSSFTIPLGILGLVLLPTLTPIKTKDFKKPAGVDAIGLFTFLFSLGLGFLSSMALALASVGFSTGPSGISEFTSLFILSYWVFALAGLLLSILVLRGLSSKHLWYILMTYWILLLAYSFARDFASFYYYARSFWLPSFLIYCLPTYVYPAICIPAFLTKKLRHHFHLISENNIT